MVSEVHASNLRQKGIGFSQLADDCRVVLRLLAIRAPPKKTAVPNTKAWLQIRSSVIVACMNLYPNLGSAFRLIKDQLNCRATSSSNGDFKP